MADEIEVPPDATPAEGVPLPVAGTVAGIAMQGSGTDIPFEATPPPPGTTLRRGEVPDTPLVPAPAQFKLFAGNLRLQPTTLTPGGADPALVTLQPGGGFQDVTFIVPPNALCPAL